MSEKKKFEAGELVQCVVAVSPGNACWHCERHLQFGFCGVSAETPHGVFVFILCSEICQIQELIEAAACGYSAHTLSQSSVQSVLDRHEDIDAVIEGEWFLGGLLVKFCTKTVFPAGGETN
jgi:hypothetical protein